MSYRVSSHSFWTWRQFHCKNPRRLKIDCRIWNMILQLHISIFEVKILLLPRKCNRLSGIFLKVIFTYQYSSWWIRENLIEQWVAKLQENPSAFWLHGHNGNAVYLFLFDLFISQELSIKRNLINSISRSYFVKKWIHFWIDSTHICVERFIAVRISPASRHNRSL